MERTAKVFLTNRSQAVRLPKEFQFAVDEVYIRREGENVILSPRPSNWDDYFAKGPIAPADFMSGIEDLPIQERKF
jgi:antitoxin VapB